MTHKEEREREKWKFWFSFQLYHSLKSNREERIAEWDEWQASEMMKERKEEKNRRRCQGFADAVDVESVGFVRLPDLVRVVEFDSTFDALVFDWSDQNFST